MRKITLLAITKPALLGLALTATISGCSLAPEYQQPVSPVPGKWAGDTGIAENTASRISSASVDWKTFVTDEHLLALIEQALDNNRDLRQLLLNVSAARAQFGIVQADQLPTIDVQASATRQRTPGDLRIPGMPGVQNSYRAGVGFTTYELDLFGRIENMTEAALQEYLATEQAAQSLQISLIADVIQSYITYQGAHKRLTLAEKIKHSREESQDKIKQRQALGAATALDFQDALSLTLQSYVEVERIRRELQLAQHALSLLAGVGDVSPYLGDSMVDTQMILQSLSPGAPSDLLQYRPDIRAAEHRLLARNANIGAARAAFFPNVSLTGFLGSSSMELSDLFNSGQRSWSFAPQISLPLFNHGRNQASLDLATVRKDIAVADYEKTIQVAFKEVSDALTSIDTLRREETAQQALAQSSSARLTLTKARYDNGTDDSLRYLDAQRASFANQLSLIEVATQKQLALSTLYRALGGGWISTETQTPSS